MMARIYKPSKSAMQSGMGKSKDWVLEFAPDAPQPIDPLTGWTGSKDTREQVKIYFETRQDAVAYARKHGIPHEVLEPRERRPVIKAYADNFKFGRVGTWTH